MGNNYKFVDVPKGKNSGEYAAKIRSGFAEHAENGASVSVKVDKHDGSRLVVSSSGTLSPEQGTHARKFGLDL